MNIDKIIKDPCKKCNDKEIDSYGYYCDLACGKHTAYLNQKLGAEKVLEYLNDKGLISSIGLIIDNLGGERK